MKDYNRLMRTHCLPPKKTKQNKPYEKCMKAAQQRVKDILPIRHCETLDSLKERTLLELLKMLPFSRNASFCVNFKVKKFGLKK